MKRKPLHVSLHAREPSVIELTVGDRVQLDRLVPASGPSPRGVLAERHGQLLDRGLNTVTLSPGHYRFKTLSDANLRVVTGGISAGITAHDKDGGPIELATGAPSAKGDEPTGEQPSLTIE